MAVDTGSTFCVFDRIYGETLGLNIESGLEQRITTATGSFYCYGHEVTIVVFGLEWQAVVYFAETDAFSLNVLGRVGFLDRFFAPADDAVAVGFGTGGYLVVRHEPFYSSYRPLRS